MNKYTLDYDSLEKAIERPKAYRYEDVKDKIVRVAYDIVRFQSPEEDIDTLWQVQATDDGDVIVAMYDEGGKTAEASAKEPDGNWNVVADGNSNMHIFYKDRPIKRIAAAQAGIPEAEVSSFCNDVKKKLNADKDFRTSLLNDIPTLDRVELFSQYPELTQ